MVLYHAVRCPVRTIARATTHGCAMCGTNMAYGATHRYAMSGTELAYAATSFVYTQSMLSLHILFVRDGEFSFRGANCRYKVEAEDMADGLSFRIDDANVQLPGTSSEMVHSLGLRA
eukprot:805474-Rhodomonas_salina.1